MLLLNPILQPRYYFFDNDKPLIGGIIHHDNVLFTDPQCIIPHRNPIKLDENASALMYFLESCDIRVHNRDDKFLYHYHLDFPSPFSNQDVFFNDKYGKPLKKGKVFIYRFQSTLEKESFCTADKSIQHDNPVILDDDGKSQIYIDGAYRLRVLNADNVLITDEDVLFGGYKWEKKYEYFSSLMYPEKRYEYLSSLMYPIIIQDILAISGLSLDGEILNFPIDNMELGAIALDGELKSILIEYRQPLEDIINLNVRAIGGEIRSILKKHHQPLEDGVKLGVYALNGEMKTILIVHHQPLEDVMKISLQCLGGELK